jgi:hypothetical protein
MANIIDRALGYDERVVPKAEPYADQYAYDQQNQAQVNKKRTPG